MLKRNWEISENTGVKTLCQLYQGKYEKAVDAVREGCLKGRLRLNSTCLGYHFYGGLVEIILSLLGIRPSLVRLKKKQLQRLLVSLQSGDFLLNRVDVRDNCIQHKTVQVFDVKRINLYNYDETNVTDDDRPRDTKRVERVQEHSRASISIMVCGNANGDLLPPMVVYKALNIYENWTQSGPVGTKYASSASVWFDMNIFEMWFFSILLPHVEATREAGDTVVLLGDNLATNATHLIQPLDVAVFAPMKKWREILDKWRRESRYPGCIPKEQFPVLLGRLWSGISDSVSQNLVSGFRATGLHPPNPTEVLKRIPDGLDDAGEVVERNIDASLRELLQEHRGSGESRNENEERK
ncbi:hypothetical protein NQ318_008007 [Aromia moschata]|uniref:DDE-1 domain-containing protein n=1 Tax=Aromia moschata TaxID=1265417 RepID=A0AAV8XUN5_9CUCU|nr:hypothetical protein NQ318_008007 [Aromia moschata]